MRHFNITYLLTGKQAMKEAVTGRRSSGSRSAGFTLVEMIVVIAIISIIVSITVYNLAGFQEYRRLSNEIQELELDLRQAQTNALAVKDQGGNFDIGYGVKWQKNGGAEGDSAYTVYYYSRPDDREAHDERTDPEDDEKLKQVELRDSFIEEIKVDPEGGGDQETVFMVFERPRPGARLYRSPSPQTDPVEVKELVITFRSLGGGYTKKMTLNQAGQISVQ